MVSSLGGAGALAAPPFAAAQGASDAHGIRFDDVSVAYGEQVVLESLTLAVKPGEIVALIGPSGSGKTTALRAVAGFVRPARGRIFIGTRDVTDLAPHARNIGMVVQNYALFPHMRAEENVAFGLRARGAGADVIRERVPECLRLVGMASYAKRYPRELSGGQQQRVAIARALAIRPQVLLLDEPLSALDAKVRVQLRDEIRRIQLEVGTTTLFVTHDQEEALAVADRVGVMRAGRIEQIDEPETIYSRPSTAFVAQFIGLTNPLPGIVENGSATVLGKPVPLLPGSPPNGAVSVLVRPEAVTVRPGGEPSGAGAATVAATSFLGAHGRVQARLGDGTLVLAQMPTGAVAELAVGDAVTVQVLPVAALATRPTD